VIILIDKKDKFTVIVFSGDLDKVLAGFVLATSAASMGMETTVFFTFWGLNVVKKNPPLIKGHGFMEKALSFMNRGGANRLPLSKMNMAGMGPWMLKKMMKQKNVQSIEDFIELSSQLKIKMVACELSMQVMGIKKEDLIDEVSEVVGGVTYLTEAKEGKVNLMIT
jgi:peroxiredoxin family protein